MVSKGLSQKLCYTLGGYMFRRSRFESLVVSLYPRDIQMKRFASLESWRSNVYEDSKKIHPVGQLSQKCS